MQQFYRIIVTPYGYDTWDIFTEDKTIFDQFCKFGETDEAVDFYGQEKWEELADAYVVPSFPYVLLGETTLRQYD